MQRFIFGFGSLPLQTLFVFLSLVLLVNNQPYCSAYCSYFQQANVYAPMCAGAFPADCTKCDDHLFVLVNATCQPHAYFNQSLQFTQLLPPMTLTLTDWQNTTNLFRVFTRLGSYQLIEFYTGNAAGIGGNDKIYKQFSLSAHYAVRLRFFVLRSTSSGVSLDYWIDHRKYHYDTSQYPTSATLGDIVTTEKLFHQSRNLTIAFQGQLTGLDQFIGIKELLIFVSKCSQFCELCDSSQNCVKCFNVPNGTKTYLHDGYCYAECPQTSFQNDTSHNCDRCQAECQNCLFNSTFCTQCKSEGRYESFLYKNACHYNCPDGFVKNYDTNECSCPIEGFFINSNHTCQACHQQCNSCFGLSRNMCYNCSAGSYLVYGMTECTKTCPAGQYGDQFAKKCELCSPLCSQCEGKSSRCKACFLGSNVRYLYDEQCVAECPRGYGSNFNLRRCETCPPFYYSYKGECMIECPATYVANNESKSCLYIGQTNYTLEPRVVAIELLPDGKSLSFQLSFSEGLTESSKNCISLQAYYKISLKKDESTVFPKSVSLENDYTFNLVFPLNEELTQNSQFCIEFTAQMNTSKSLNYSRKTKVFKISQYPQFLAQYLKNGSKSFFNIMIIPIVIAISILIGLRLKGTYELFIQTIRMFQLVGLAVFLHYPLEGPMYSLLEAFNYFNLEFLPNIYNWSVPKFATSFQKQVFAAFTFVYGDMDFIRMIGSILLFIAVLILLIFFLKVFVVKKVQILGWLLRLGMDLVETKIMHSFWNSFIFTFANSEKDNIYMLWVHLVSYIFMGLVGFRYYKIYQNNGSINYGFAWRLISTLLISIALFNKMIVLIILCLISVVYGFRNFHTTRELNTDLLGFKFGIAFLMRDSVMALLPWLSVMAICMISFYKEQMDCISVIITLGTFTYVLIAVEVVIFILIRYFFIKRQKTSVRNDQKGNQKGAVEYNKVEQHGTLSSVSQSFNEDNESYIRDQFTADFANAHQKTIPDESNANPHQEDTKMRRTVERTIANSSAATKMEVSLEHEQTGNPKVEGFGKIENKLYPQESNRNSDHDQELFESKLKRAHRTQALKKKEGKVEPLQTLSLRKESQTQFEHITLKKVQEDKQEDKVREKQVERDRNKEEDIERDKQEERERINLTDMTKRGNSRVNQADNSSSPGLRSKTNVVRIVGQNGKNSKLSTEQNISVNEDYQN